MSNLDRLHTKFTDLLPAFANTKQDPRWADIRNKFNADSVGKKVLADFLREPANAEMRERFLMLMKIYLESDAGFAEAVDNLFGSSQAVSRSDSSPFRGGIVIVEKHDQQKSLLKKLNEGPEESSELSTRRSSTRATKNSDLNKRAKPPFSGNIDFSIPSFEVEQSAPPEQPKEDVSFTTMYPREVKPEKWNTMLFYVHMTDALAAVKKDAERFKDQIPESKDVTAKASTPLARGTELTIIPICDGVTFNPPRAGILWLEDLHRVEFRFRADPSLLDDAAKGSIEVRVGPLIVGTLKLSFLVSNDAPEAAAPQQDEGTMYHQDDIFISYSHKDTDLVLPFKKAYEAIGNNVLIDIDTLRSGQEWNAELMRMIERAEIFQLFWSENSSASKYCKQEWEHALNLKREGFVRPCYWQKPMPNPPDELRHLHFEFVQM